MIVAKIKKIKETKTWSYRILVRQDLRGKTLKQY